MVPFAGLVTVTLYFVFGVGLDGLGLGVGLGLGSGCGVGLGLGGFEFPCSGFSGGGLVKSGGGQEFYVIAYKK